MINLNRSLIASLLIHGVAIYLLVHFGTGLTEQQPVTIDLTLANLAGGSPDRAMAGSTGKASKGTPTAPIQTGVSRLTAPFPESSLQKKLAEKPVLPAPTTVTALQPQNRTPQPPPHAATTVQATVPLPQSPREGITTPARQAMPGAAGSNGSGAGLGGQGSGSGGSGSETGKGTGGGSESGTGSGSGKGSGKGNGSGLPPEFDYIMKIIQRRMIYPTRAKREGLTGRARISFMILENGQVSNIRIITSTGYQILDLNAVETIRDAAPFPKPPRKAELIIPMTYRLEQ